MDDIAYELVQDFIADRRYRVGEILRPSGNRASAGFVDVKLTNGTAALHHTFVREVRLVEVGPEAA